MNSCHLFSAAKQDVFPTKEPVTVFNAKNTPKGAKTPANEGAKTSKGANKTPKGAKTPVNEGNKTPKGAKTPGGEGGVQDKAKKIATTTPTQNGVSNYCVNLSLLVLVVCI